MKHLSFYFILLSIIWLSSCDKKVSLQSNMSLGDNINYVMSVIESDSWLEANQIDDNHYEIIGGQYFINQTWDRVYLAFENDLLQQVIMVKPFYQVSDSQIREIKDFLREKCGDGFSDTERMIAAYGLKSDNNGALGGIKFEPGELGDDFVVVIKLPDYSDN